MNIPEAMKQITDAAEIFVASTPQDGFRISDVDIIDKSKIVFRKDAPNKTELVLGDDFEVVVEDGKTYVVRKKPQYPKTYEECCKIIATPSRNEIVGHKWKLLQLFQKLLICRDAYWKLVGNWKPDWNNDKEIYHVIATTKGDIGLMSSLYVDNTILAFPSEEMRDDFYENFKDLIESCKELL